MANTEPTWPDFDAAMAGNAINAAVGLPELPALSDLNQSNALNFDAGRWDTEYSTPVVNETITDYGFAGNTNVAQGLDPVGNVSTGYFSTNEPISSSTLPNVTDYGFGTANVSQGLGTVGSGSLGTSLQNSAANYYDTNASPYYNATGFGAAGATPQVAQNDPYDPARISVGVPWDYPDITVTDASRFADDPFEDATFGPGDANAYGDSGRMAGGFGRGDANAYGGGGRTGFGSSPYGPYATGDLMTGISSPLPGMSPDYFAGAQFGYGDADAYGYGGYGGYYDPETTGSVGYGDYGGGYGSYGSGTYEADPYQGGFFAYDADMGGGGWGDTTNWFEEGISAVEGPAQGSGVFGGFADANSAMGALSAGFSAGLDPATAAGIMNAAGVTAQSTGTEGQNLGALAAAAALAGDEVGAQNALAAAEMGGVGAEASGAMGGDPSGGNAGNPSGAGGTGTPGTGGDSGAAAGGGGQGGDSGGGGGSFICSAIFKPGPELTLLTQFRDVFPGRDLRTYYVYGPKIVAAIKALPDGKQRLADIQTKWVNPALASIKAGDIDAAYDTYCDMVQELAKQYLNKELRRHGRVRDQAA